MVAGERQVGTFSGHKSARTIGVLERCSLGFPAHQPVKENTMVGPREQWVRVPRSFPGHCHLVAAWRERATYELGRSLEGTTFTSCLEPCASPPGSALQMPTSRGVPVTEEELNAMRCRAGCVWQLQSLVLYATLDACCVAESRWVGSTWNSRS